MNALRIRLENALASPRAIHTLSTNDTRAAVDAAIQALNVFAMIATACREAEKQGQAISPASLLEFLTSANVIEGDNGNGH